MYEGCGFLQPAKIPLVESYFESSWRGKQTGQIFPGSRRPVFLLTKSCKGLSSTSQTAISKPFIGPLSSWYLGWLMIFLIFRTTSSSSLNFSGRIPATYQKLCLGVQVSLPILCSPQTTCRSFSFAKVRDGLAPQQELS